MQARPPVAPGSLPESVQRFRIGSESDGASLAGSSRLGGLPTTTDGFFSQKMTIWVNKVNRIWLRV